MKDKIIFFIIGILIGAIIATTGFWIYSKNVKSNNQPEMMQMDENNQIGNSTSGNMGEPPTKPEDINQNSNS